MNQAADQPMPPEPGSATIRADRAKRADTTFADTTSVDTGSLLELAVFLARQAGTTIVEMRDEAITSATTKSSPTDPVTAADSAAEKIIVNGLRQHRPDDAVIGEEGTDSEGSTGVRWLVDPIDGTVNFLYGLPAYSVSIAAAIGTQTVAGVVYNPISDELFTASLGSGAHLNGSAISVTKRPDPSKALVATGFSYRSDRRRIQAQLLTAVLPRIGDLRRLGSAALDLCAVAAGRVDAFYEEGLNVWDYAAGKLLVEEAGGRCDIRDDLVPGAETLIAGSPIMVDTLADLLAKAASQADRG